MAQSVKFLPSSAQVILQLNIRVKHNEVKVNEVLLLCHRIFTLHKGNAEVNQIEVNKVL